MHITIVQICPTGMEGMDTQQQSFEALSPPLRDLQTNLVMLVDLEWCEGKMTIYKCFSAP